MGHGTVRGSVLGPDARPPTTDELAAMVREVDAAMDAGAIGLSSGLIYAPGLHADLAELQALAGAAARHGGLYATHMRNEAAGLFDALDEAIATDPRRRRRARGSRSRTSSAAPREVWGRGARGGRACSSAPAPRASTSPPTSTRTPPPRRPSTTILPPALLGLGVDACVAALADLEVRALVKAEIDRGTSGWEDIARDPGWGSIRISYAASHPDWSGRTLTELSDGPRAASRRTWPSRR